MNREEIIEEKAKRYDEAINAIKELKAKHPTALVIKDWIKENFPELVESEDERIRKELIEQVAYIVPNNDETDNEGNVLPIYQQRIDKYIAYLEKQGELVNSLYKGLDNAHERIDGLIQKNNSLIEQLEKQGEQKAVDKVDSKFKDGDWVVYKNDICQIVKREEGCNKLVTNFGIKKELVNERNLSTARLWAIQDAKDGDVLTTDMCIIVFKHEHDGDIFMYCGYSLVSNLFFISDTATINAQYLHPATKEQRDLLFQKMHEAGYEWDAEKKELKKIAWSEKKGEQKEIDYNEELKKCKNNPPYFFDKYVKFKEPKCEWSEEDDIMVHDIDYALRCQITYPISRLQSMSAWINNLKNRVQPKQEWSEEDERIYQSIMDDTVQENQLNETQTDWLRDIKYRYFPQCKQKWIEEDEE